jgi:hypothetical protein
METLLYGQNCHGEMVYKPSKPKKDCYGMAFCRRCGRGDGAAWHGGRLY